MIFVKPLLLGGGFFYMQLALTLAMTTRQRNVRSDAERRFYPL